MLNVLNLNYFKWATGAKKKVCSYLKVYFQNIF